MALIKCTGCGHDVSDKASECPHCGCPISQEKSNICKECGEPIPENASVCPNCGCPIENNEAVQEVYYDEEPEKKKWWIWALVIALLCLGGGYYAYAKHFKGENEKDAIVELTPEFINSIQKYNKLGSFSEGYAAVLKDEKWGYINTKGEEVISCQYSNPYEEYTSGAFHEGLAAVQKDGKWGFINTKGEEVIPISIEAESIGRFSEGLAFVYIDEENFSVINKEGKTVFKGKADFSWYLGSDVASELLPVYSQGNICVPLEPDKFAVYDNQGNKIREINQESRDELDKQNETKAYTIFIKENGDDEDNQYNTVGLKAANGTELIPAIYDGIGNVGAGEKIDAPNGVVLVILDEIGEDAIEGYGGEFDSPDTKRYYGYADLKGNDTFSNEIKEKCRKTKEKALQKMKEDVADYDADDYEADDYDKPSYANTSNGGERIVTIYMKGEKDMDSYSSLDGNFGVHNYKNAEERLWTDAISIPQGKVWVFKDCKKDVFSRISSRIVFSAGFLEERDASFIIRYGGNSVYDAPTWKDLNNMNGERFYGGKVIRLVCELGRAFDGPISFNLEVNFIEKDD